MSAVAKVIPDDGPADDSYVSRTGQDPIPVQKDEAPVEDPINPATADSDEALGEPSYPFFFLHPNPPSKPLPLSALLELYIYTFHSANH